MSASGIGNQQGIRVQIGRAVERQTPRTDFGSVVATGAGKTADAVLGAVGLAMPFIPGGAVLSAAVTGVGNLRTSMAGRAGTTAGGSNAVGLSYSGTRGSGGLGGTSGAASGSNAFNAVAANAAGGDSSAQLMMATREMQEMNQSFNLQYLQLQQKMQGDSRQFTLLSNIMKTKNDTAKNAIGNIR